MTFDSGDAEKRVAKYADESMFVAERAGGLEPVVKLISGPNDPLGTLAYLAKTYQGIFPDSLAEISDRDRQYYIFDQEKNVLGMPSEGVQFHFLIENVSRSFTHQLVRTRHAAYAQESLRFAVKEDFPCGIPRFLEGTKSLNEEIEQFGRQMGWVDEAGFLTVENYERAENTVVKNATLKQKERFKFDERNDKLQEWYLDMIDQGWPAEDARGILPHWILTKINMVIPLNSLMGMAGKRLCTQAQWEHKLVWDGILRALREYGHEVTYRTNDPARYGFGTRTPTDPWGYHAIEIGDSNGDLMYERSSAWQYEVLANRFKPICYQEGRCKFRSDFDRYCNIRDRVEANAAINRPSSEWHKPHLVEEVTAHHSFDITEPVSSMTKTALGIPAIGPHEWLDPNAALRPDGEWRSDEAKANIAGRRL